MFYISEFYLSMINPSCNLRFESGGCQYLHREIQCVEMGLDV
jgi:hypothetical protein